MDSYQKLEDNDISYKLSKHNPFCMLEFGQVERDITYNIDNYITSLPEQLPIAWLYEEKIKF